jgi:hypothetical protein
VEKRKPELSHVNPLNTRLETVHHLFPPPETSPTFKEGSYTDNSGRGCPATLQRLHRECHCLLQTNTTAEADSTVADSVIYEISISAMLGENHMA